MIDEDDSHYSLEKPLQKPNQLQYPAFNNWLPGVDEQQALPQLAYSAAPADFMPMMPV